MAELKMKTDPARFGDNLEPTGFYVRAQNEAGVFSAFDLIRLDRVSMMHWLRSRGGSNLWCENFALIILGHKPYKDEQEYVHETVAGSTTG